MKHCLVVGASGFLGRHLCEALLARGYAVTGTYHNHKNNIPANVTALSINDALLKQTYTTVFIVAAFVPKETTSTTTEALFTANVSLVEKVSKAQPESRLVYCSTVSVYGDTTAIITEQTPKLPNTAYGLSKLWGEHIVSKHNSYAIVRFSSLFGEEMYTGTFVPAIINSALSAKNITLFGNGSRAQNYLYVKDAVAYSIAASVYDKNETFLAVSSMSVTNLEIATIVQEEIDKTTISFSGQDNTSSFVYDNKFTRETLHLSKHQPLSVSIKKLVQWMKK